MPSKSKPRAATTAVTVPTFVFDLHPDWYQRVPVLSAEQRRILTAPDGTLEARKDAIHRALLGLRCVAPTVQNACLAVALVYTLPVSIPTLPQKMSRSIHWTSDAG
jgi:hypothetical protein